MSEKKHIDRLFQEKFKNFEATPDDVVWENIHNKLHKDKRKRRVLPLWWKVAGVAALLALLFTVRNLLINDSSNNINTKTVVETPETPANNYSEDSEKNKTVESISNETDAVADGNSTSKDSKQNVSSDSNKQNFKSVPDEDNVVTNDNSTQKDLEHNASNDSKNKNVTSLSNNSNESVVSNKQKSNTQQKKPSKLNTETDDAVAHSDDKKSNKNTIDKNTISSDELINTEKNKNNVTVANASEKPEKKLVFDDLINIKKDINNAVANNSETKKDSTASQTETQKVEQTIEEAIAEANTINEKEEEKQNRWNISPNVAPVYFNSLGKGSSIDEQFVDNSKDGEVNMSYGIGGSYAISNRLKIRAGVNKVNMGYGTNNVISFAGVDSSSVSRQHLGNVNFNENSQNMAFISSENLDLNRSPEIINTKTKGTLDQRFGFIEVPIELEYAVVNKKLGVNLIGGFSTLIVDKNEVYSVVDGNETLIGEANNINNMSYSANLGLGINYNISDKVKINLEPTFKYQINTFNNSAGDFQPYFIGVYTGLSYKF